MHAHINIEDDFTTLGLFNFVICDGSARINRLMFISPGTRCDVVRSRLFFSSSGSFQFYFLPRFPSVIFSDSGLLRRRQERWWAKRFCWNINYFLPFFSPSFSLALTGDFGGLRQKLRAFWLFYYFRYYRVDLRSRRPDTG